MAFLIRQTLIYAIPLMVVALAGVFAERSGIINLALEGMMIFGAYIGVVCMNVMMSLGWFDAVKASGNMWTTQWYLLLAMFISALAGGLAGTAGALYSLSGNTEFFWTTYQSLPAVGFTGIAVALLAVNNPIGVIFSGVFMSLLNINGQQLTNLTAYNEYITDVIIAVIVYLSAFMLIIKTWIGRRKKSKPKTEAAKAKEKAEEVHG